MKKLFEIFFAFFRVGALTFGGGYSMMPMLEKELIEKKKWITKDDILDFFAVGQCIPGVIAVNTSVMAGKMIAGVPGAIFAALGVVAPSLIVILAIAVFLSNFASIELVQRAFAGIRIAVAALIVNVVINTFKSGIKNVFTFILFLAVFVLSLFLRLSPIVYVLCCAALGIAYKLLIEKEGAK